MSKATTSRRRISVNAFNVNQNCLQENVQSKIYANRPFVFTSKANKTAQNKSHSHIDALENHQMHAHIKSNTFSFITREIELTGPLTGCLFVVENSLFNHRKCQRNEIRTRILQEIFKSFLLLFFWCISTRARHSAYCSRRSRVTRKHFICLSRAAN